MAIDIAELGLSVRSDGVVVADKRLRDLEKQSKKTETATERLVRQTESLSKQMSSLGKTMALRVTAPLLLASGAAVRFAGNFESSFASIRKTVNATEPEFAKMSAEIRELAKTVPTAVEELNELGGVAGQLGVESKNIVTFVKTLAMLGDTTDIVGEQAALSLSRFMNIMGTAQEQIDRIGATVVGLGNNFAAMESEIVDGATSLASFGRQLNFTEAQVLAFAAAIASSGGETEAASSAFQKTAITMQRAVLETNKDLSLFANIAKTSTTEFSRIFREDASGAMVLFLQGLKDISDQGLSTAAALETLGLTDIRLQREFGKVIGNLDQLKGALKVAADEWELNTALTEEARKRYETFNSWLKILWNNIKDFGITIGNDLIPVIRDLGERVRGMTGFLQELNPETRKTIIVIGGLVAVLGPLLIVLGAITRVVAPLIPLLVTLGTLLGGLPVVLGIGATAAIGFATSLETVEERATRAKEALDNLTTAQLRSAIEAMKVERDAAEATIFRMEQTSRGYAAQERAIDIQRRRLDEINERLQAYGLTLSNITNGISESTGEFVNSASAIDNAAVSTGTAGISIDTMTEKVRDQIIELAKQQAMLHMTEKQADIFSEVWQAYANGAGPESIRVIAAQAAALFDQAEAIEKAKQATENEKFIESLVQQKKALGEGAKAWRAYEKAMFQSQAVAELGDKATSDQIETVRELADAIFELQNPINGLSESLRQTGQDAISALSAMQDMFKDGSKESKVLGVAIQAINVALAIQAILSQASKGDPYTAFARMAAMAAAVIPLVGAIGASFGGLGDTSGAEQRQASQGTGTVLGDPAKQSESIINAVETTADATSKLVGISTGMLNALRELQAGIAGATTKIAGGEQAFTELQGTSALENALFGTGSFNLFGLNFVGELLRKWFGGKSEIIDEGIVIAAGTMNDLIERTLVGAFQEVKSKKSIFHSTKIKTETIAFGESVSAQFALVFESMFNAVTESALALGILDDDITSALENFRIEEQKISLLGLSGEDQESAIQAVFSKIFDDLASAVIPFIHDFQKVGEGLGETLVRVATNVQVMEEAIIRLGLNAERVSAEQFAHMSVDLIELAGGLDQFINSMENFISKFADDERKFEIASNDMTRAFERVGLTIPETRAGLFDLIKTLDATTETGMNQIATILRLADTADAYYDFLEDAEEERLEKQKESQKELNELYDNAAKRVADSLESITDPINDLMKTIRNDIASITDTLNSTVQSTIAQQVSNFEELRRQALANHADEIKREEELHNTRLRLADSLAQFANSLRTGQLSPLANRDRFELAQEGFRTTLAAAMGGDVKASERLQAAAQSYAELSREMFASSMAHVNNMDEILNGLDAAAGLLGASTFNPQEANDRLIVELQLINAQLASLPTGISGELEPLFNLMMASGLAAGQSLQQIATRINSLLAVPGVVGGSSGSSSATNPYAKYAYTAQDAQSAINAIVAKAGSEGAAVAQAASVLQSMGFSSTLLDQLGIGGTGGATASELLARYGIPAFETGGPIMETGPVVAHRGEHVINAERDNLIVNVQSNTDDISELRDILKEIRDNEKRYQEVNLAESKNIQRALSTQTEAIRKAS